MMQDIDIKSLDLLAFTHAFHVYEDKICEYDASLVEAQHSFMSSLLDFMCKHVLLKAFDLDEAFYRCKHELTKCANNTILLKIRIVHPDNRETFFFSDSANISVMFKQLPAEAKLEDNDIFMKRVELVMLYQCFHTLFSGIYECTFNLDIEVIKHEHEEAMGFTYDVDEEKQHILNVTLPYIQTAEELLGDFMLAGLDFMSFLEARQA